jgi:SAM-dependent methyltransferase
MPGESYWSTFFDPEAVLRALGLDSARGRVIDVGCGYGTFTLPAARLTSQDVLAVDIEQGLAEEVAARARAQGIARVYAVTRDVAADGLGEPDSSADIVLLFNLLHCEDPAHLLREARRVLAPGGRLGAIHWRSDVPTPRGPDLAIRPRPEDIKRWLVEACYAVEVEPMILPPFHFGLVGRKPDGR